MNKTTIKRRKVKKPEYFRIYWRLVKLYYFRFNPIFLVKLKNIDIAAIRGGKLNGRNILRGFIFVAMIQRMKSIEANTPQKDQYNEQYRYSACPHPFRVLMSITT